MDSLIFTFAITSAFIFLTRRYLESLLGGSNKTPGSAVTNHYDLHESCCLIVLDKLGKYMMDIVSILAVGCRD